MGGGGKHPDSSYEDYIAEMHAFILAGTIMSESDGMASDLDPLAADVGGLAGFYEATRSSAIGQTPYAALTAFSPSDSNSRFHELLDEVDEYVDSIDGNEPSIKYTDNFDLMEAQVDAIWDSTATDDLADEVEEFKKKRQTDFYEELGEQQAQLSAINATGGTQFGVSAGLLMRRYNREVGDYREKLKLEHHSFRRQAAISQSLILAEKQSQYFNIRSKSIGVLSQVTDIWSTALRQKKEDELGLAIEDIFWDGKLYDFLGKALGSISGSAVVPSGSHGENQTLNTISTIAAVGSQAAGVFGDIRDNRNAARSLRTSSVSNPTAGPNGGFPGFNTPENYTPAGLVQFSTPPPPVLPPQAVS